MSLRTSAALIIALAASSVASASVIQFDPDGAGPAPSISASSFDWLPGDAMLQVTSSTTANLYFQAKLGAILNSNNQVIPTPGLNAPANQPGYEITIAFGVPVNVSLSSTTIIVNSVDTTSPNPSYLSIYFDPSRDANNLAGTGFRDGLRIYNSSVNEALAGIVGIQSFQPLDLFNPSNYAGTITQTVTGGGTIGGSTVTLDPSFFLDGSSIVATQLTNGTLVGPFTDVDPSAQYEVGPDGSTSILPYGVHATNGADGAPQLESDAATSFTTVPEPGTLIAGLPVLGLLLHRRRHNQHS